MAAAGDPLRATSAAVAGVPATAMLAAVKAVKRVATEEARRDAGGDGALSHLGYRQGRYRPVKLTLRDDLKVGTGQASARLTGGGATGAWALINAGAVPHVIGATSSRGKRKGQARNLRIGTRWVRGPVRHPGARGKGTFDRVVRRAQAEVPKVVEAELVRAVTKSLRG